jgi:hypothetical protein
MAIARLLLLLLACFFSGAVHAVHGSFALEKFLPFPSLELRCVADDKTIEIPIPSRWKINSAKLKVHYAVSSAVISKISNLTIRLNNQVLVQTKLVQIPENEPLTIDVPVSAFKPGYNKLSFVVSQHYTENSCEMPCNTTLWTSIKLPTSSLEFDYDLRPVPMQLGSVSEFIFDPRLVTENKVHLVFNTADEQSSSLAAIAASGIARRFDYRKVTFTTSDLIEPGRDNVIIGTEAFVRPLIGNAFPAATETRAGLLKILPMPGKDGEPDFQRALIVVTGKTIEEVKTAAMTFANISLAYPGSDEMQAVNFTLPDIAAYGGRSVISADKTYELKTLDLPTQTLAGLNPQPARINFRLPADFLIKQNRVMQLVLNFAYGAGMRTDSALNIVVNGVAVRAIPLNNVEGGYFQNYELEIPTYVFRPGDNTILFVPELHVNAKECDLILPGNLFVTIFDNSTFKFPYMPHFIDMPRMELFMLNGFPFTRWPDGFEGKIYIARPSLDALAATMNVIGLMTQKNGFPLLNLELAFKPPTDPNGDLMVVGDVFSLPKNLADASPLRLGKVSRIPYPIVRNWQLETTYAFSSQISKMGSDRGLMMQFESPLQPGRSVLLFAADDQRDLVRLSEELLDPEIQGQINGDLSLFEFNEPKTKVTSLLVGERYTTGKQGKVDWVDIGMDRLDSLLFARKTVFYGLLLVGILGLSWMLYLLIRKYRAKRLATIAGKLPGAKG